MVTYECYVKDNLTFDVQSHKYATVKAVLTVDNAAISPLMRDKAIIIR